MTRSSDRAVPSDQARRQRALGAGAALAIALLAACGPSASPSPSPAGSPSAPASNAAPSAAADQACAATDVRASGRRWDGAAGSRFSEVTIENVGAGTCMLPLSPVAALVDEGGEVLAQSAPSAAGGGPALPAGGSVAFTVQLTNWCDQSATLPLHVELLTAEGRTMISGLAISSGELPPCNAPGQPPTISATDWGSP